MMSMKWTSALLLLQMSFYFNSGSCGKVLVWPMDYSHWMNIKNILEELIQRRHEVTVLRPSSFIFVDINSSSGIKFETFTTSASRDDWEKYFTKWITTWMNLGSISSCFAYFPEVEKIFKEFSDTWQNLCKETVSNKILMNKLQESRFDVLLADPIAPCGELVAELLKIPFVYTLRASPGFQLEKFGGGLILPPSYVPVVMSGLGGQMTFMERVKNMICMLYFDFWVEMLNEKKWNQLYSEVLGKRTTIYDTTAKAEMWLIRSYWDLEFPHPSLPNFDFVGGLHCKPAKPLPKEMEDFVQSSGEHGVVVFSLGSMVSNMTTERANMIASALAQIPQKVLWRFDGKKPDTLGPNTRLYKWLPQNDLLEQHDNIAHMKAKGAAVKVEFITLSSTELLNALDTVLNNTSYKENAMWLSTIHHDQPVKPLDRAVFWIEFVMRHKGAKHLRPLAQNLTWYQYHSLDVIGFLLACVATVTFLVIKSCLFCSQKFVKKGKKQKRE
ncbi:UDP-glucuronosyltransferase 2B17 isoform X2 [Heterocephalus glaber]|uniref:glucuronosyltransferase n=1 Tax=Heterocephalus glaber TaxID=10181 RepID=A0AAX6S879_HETGA|nr:UDP-glucuronosyltransferase 2B17 isoform X2 [Heterocephalus glaber]